MKFRIGNDIRILVKLSNKNQVGDVKIDSVRAYIINKSKVISRFPIEPTHDCYLPNNYNINSAGCPKYHSLPQNSFYSKYDDLIYDPHWRYIYKRVPWCNETGFLAPVFDTKYKNVIEILFPAGALVFTGDYRIVIVAKFYEEGYTPNNIRTITVDYDDVFTLVDSSEEGVDTGGTINITDTGQILVLKGDRNIIAGKTYNIQIDSSTDIGNIRWFCNEPKVTFLEQDNNHLLYTVGSLTDEESGMEFEILVLSDEDGSMLGKITIYAYAGTLVDDIYANSGEVDRQSGSVKINLNNGKSFDIDMSPELLWYEGN